MSEQDKRELEAFGRMAQGMETRRKELLAEAHRRAETELHQYRMTVLSKLEELVQKHNASQIVKATGLARSTVYRWLERLRNERIIAEAVSKGIAMETLGGMGGFGAASVVDLPKGDAPAAPTKTHSELGWRNVKRLVSGEIGATDNTGNVWVFNSETGEGWNKTENINAEGRENWPEGAEDLVDSLTQ